MPRKAVFGIMLTLLLLLIMDLTFNSIQTLSTLKVHAYNDSGTTVGGVISENTTWTLENSPYIFVDNVIVLEGVTLTIEPGVSINFDLWMLTINGTLYARGNQSHRIIMYSYEEPLFKYYPRIDFTPSSTPWDEIKQLGCIIEYAEIRFYYHSSVMIRGNFAKISNCIIISHGSTALSTKGIVSNNKIVGYYTGIIAGGNCTVSHNIVLDAEHGIHLGKSSPRYPSDADSPIVVGNLLLDNYYGITLSGSWGRPYIANNTLARNVYGFLCPSWYSGGNFTIVYNNIYDRFKVEKEDPRITINVTHNWWGTTNTSLIDQKIYDQNDNRRLCLINYKPILTSPAIAPPVLSNIQISAVTQEPEPEKVEPHQEVIVRANVTDQIFGVGTVMLGYSTDGGLTWNRLTMYYNETLGLYEAVIPGQEENVFVKYYIYASDKINEYYVNEDNNGQYFTYTVVPEFPSITILLLLMLVTLIAIIPLKKRKTRLTIS